MGLIGKVLGAKLSANMMDRALRKQEATATPTGEYLPAGQVTTGGLRQQAGAVVDRAGQIYRQNPKLIGGLATLAAAALLVGMKRKA